MTIPESQLLTWARRGPWQVAESTHNSVRHAISAGNLRVRGLDPEVYLQGSYRNATNVRGNSDVDLVVQLNSVFLYDSSSLSVSNRALLAQTIPPTSYSWWQFRAEVLNALRVYYGIGTVSEGSKSIKVAQGSNRLPADVVAALQYRRYFLDETANLIRCVEGIAFHSLKDGGLVVNYPKVDYENGAANNNEERTNGQYKPSVRIFKNCRDYLVDKGHLRADLVKSHFLESLLYNVPDSAYQPSLQNTFYNILNWLLQADYTAFVFQHHQSYLFGQAAEQWSAPEARQFVASTVNLWNNWQG
jgi:hypothetical protein